MNEGATASLEANQLIALGKEHKEQMKAFRVKRLRFLCGWLDCFVEDVGRLNLSENDMLKSAARHINELLKIIDDELED